MFNDSMTSNPETFLYDSHLQQQSSQGEGQDEHEPQQMLSKSKYGWVELVGNVNEIPDDSSSSNNVLVFCRAIVNDLTGKFELFQDETMNMILFTVILGHPKIYVAVIKDVVYLQNIHQESCAFKCETNSDAQIWAKFLCYPMFSPMPITKSSECDWLYENRKDLDPSSTFTSQSSPQQQQQQQHLDDNLLNHLARQQIQFKLTEMSRKQKEFQNEKKKMKILQIKKIKHEQILKQRAQRIEKNPKLKAKLNSHRHRYDNIHELFRNKPQHDQSISSSSTQPWQPQPPPMSRSQREIELSKQKRLARQNYEKTLQILIHNREQILKNEFATQQQKLLATQQQQREFSEQQLLKDFLSSSQQLLPTEQHFSLNFISPEKQFKEMNAIVKIQSLWRGAALRNSLESQRVLMEIQSEILSTIESAQQFQSFISNQSNTKQQRPQQQQHQREDEVGLGSAYGSGLGDGYGTDYGEEGRARGGRDGRSGGGTLSSQAMKSLKELGYEIPSHFYSPSKPHQRIAPTVPTGAAGPAGGGGGGGSPRKVSYFDPNRHQISSLISAAPPQSQPQQSHSQPHPSSQSPLQQRSYGQTNNLHPYPHSQSAQYPSNNFSKTSPTPALQTSFLSSPNTSPYPSPSHYPSHHYQQQQQQQQQYLSNPSLYTAITTATGTGYGSATGTGIGSGTVTGVDDHSSINPNGWNTNTSQNEFYLNHLNKSSHQGYGSGHPTTEQTEKNPPVLGTRTAVRPEPSWTSTANKDTSFPSIVSDKENTSNTQRMKLLTPVSENKSIVSAELQDRGWGYYLDRHQETSGIGTGTGIGPSLTSSASVISDLTDDFGVAAERAAGGGGGERGGGVHLDEHELSPTPSLSPSASYSGEAEPVPMPLPVLPSNINSNGGNKAPTTRHSILQPRQPPQQPPQQQPPQQQPQEQQQEQPQEQQVSWQPSNNQTTETETKSESHVHQAEIQQKNPNLRKSFLQPAAAQLPQTQSPSQSQTQPQAPSVASRKSILSPQPHALLSQPQSQPQSQPPQQEQLPQQQPQHQLTPQPMSSRKSILSPQPQPQAQAQSSNRKSILQPQPPPQQQQQEPLQQQSQQQHQLTPHPVSSRKSILTPQPQPEAQAQPSNPTPTPNSSSRKSILAQPQPPPQSQAQQPVPPTTSRKSILTPQQAPASTSASSSSLSPQETPVAPPPLKKSHSLRSTKSSGSSSSKKSQSQFGVYMGTELVTHASSLDEIPVLMEKIQRQREEKTRQEAAAAEAEAAIAVTTSAMAAAETVAAAAAGAGGGGGDVVEQQQDQLTKPKEEQVEEQEGKPEPSGEGIGKAIRGTEEATSTLPPPSDAVAASLAPPASGAAAASAAVPAEERQDGNLKSEAENNTKAEDDASVSSSKTAFEVWVGGKLIGIAKDKSELPIIVAAAKAQEKLRRKLTKAKSSVKSKSRLKSSSSKSLGASGSDSVLETEEGEQQQQGREEGEEEGEGAEGTAVASEGNK